MTTPHASLTHASSVLHADAYEALLETRRPHTTARDHAYTAMKNLVRRPKPLNMGFHATSTPAKHLPPLSCDYAFRSCCFSPGCAPCVDTQALVVASCA